MALVPMEFDDAVDYQDTLAGVFVNPSGDATVMLSKYGRIVTVYLTLASNNLVPSGSWTVKYTMKDKYKPKTRFDIAAVNSHGVANGWARISDDGRIMFYQETGSNQQYGICATYISNE